MDIKTLFYLANFEHNFDDFKQRLDTHFKVDNDPNYKISIEGMETWQPQMNPPLPSEVFTFTPEEIITENIQGPLPSYDYWMDVRIDEVDTKEKKS